MMLREDLERLKKLNKVSRICHAHTSKYSKDIVEGLMQQIQMLQKQKKFLQTKLREKINDAKTKTITTDANAYGEDKC